MSSATLVEPVVESPKTIVESRKTLAVVPARPQLEPAEQAASDPHPLLTVGIAMVIAFAGAAAFVGSILMWLALRHSGVMAP